MKRMEMLLNIVEKRNNINYTKIHFIPFFPPN